MRVWSSVQFCWFMIRSSLLLQQQCHCFLLHRPLDASKFFHPFIKYPLRLRRLSLSSTTVAAASSDEDKQQNSRMERQHDDDDDINYKKDGGPPLVVVIAGPTATGKSDVAAKLCHSFRRGMIVSADSVQAYRGVQIGANKPTAQEQIDTPHVLIDVANHTESYNAAEWRDDAIFCVQTLLLEEEQQQQMQTQMQQNEMEQEAIVSKRKRQEDIQKYIQKSRQELFAADHSHSPKSGQLLQEPLLPVVCGGTMMYLQWLVHGRPDACRPTHTAVQAAHSLMEKFQQQEEVSGYTAAVAYVSSFGDVFANRTRQFCGQDWYRLRRTLEIALTVQEQAAAAAGKNAESNGENGTSEVRTNQSSVEIDLVENLYSGERQGSLSSLGYDVRCFFLCPDDRMSHTKVVDERCEQMILRGLIQETTDLKLAGRLPEMAERAIGYRQTLEYLERELGEGETEGDLFENYLDDFTTATRRYAKKQMSWFRKDEEFLFVPVPLQLNKANRVASVSKSIEACCRLSRKDFYEQLRSSESSSAVCKEENQKQGKTMKFYQFQRHILKPGSQEYANALAEAVESRKRIQSSIFALKSQQDDKNENGKRNTSFEN